MEAILRTYEVSIGYPNGKKRSQVKDKSRFIHKDYQKKKLDFLD
jgi:hypothetical protein